MWFWHDGCAGASELPRPIMLGKVDGQEQ